MTARFNFLSGSGKSAGKFESKPRLGRSNYGIKLATYSFSGSTSDFQSGGREFKSRWGQAKIYLNKTENPFGPTLPD